MEIKNKIYNFGGCEIRTKNKRIICKQRKSKSIFIGINKDKAEIIKIEDVDKHLNIKGKACDFLIVNTESDNAYFIELKGKEILHAIEQLQNTISEVKKNYNTNFANKKSFVIATKCPIASKDLNNLKRKFRKETKSTLTIKNMKIEVSI